MSIEELRRKVHAAADKVEVPPPPADLLSGEVRRLPGRRRVGVALAAAAAVLAVIGIGAVVVDRGDRDGAPVVAGEQEATNGALLAVALEHADVRPTGLEALTEADLRYGRGTVGGDIRFGPEEASDGQLLRVTATPGRMPEGLCESRRTCDRIQTEQGEALLRWQLMIPEEDPGIVAVSLQAGDEWHMAYYAGQAILRDPREMESLPVGVDQMVAIVTDPRFGLRTSAEAVAAGRKLAVSGEDRQPDVEGGPVEDWSPRALAGFVQDQLGEVRSARPSTLEEPAGPTGDGEGIHAELTYGTRLDLMLVAEPGSRPLACPAGYRCYTGDDDTVYAWRPGGRDLAILRDRGEFAVRLWIHDPQFRVSSRRDFLDNVLVQLAELTAHPALGPRMSAQYAEVPLEGWQD